MIKKVKEILRKSLTLPEDDTGAANDILRIFVENQGRHKIAWLSSAVEFNFKLLQKLPDKIKRQVCENLKIDLEAGFLKKTDWRTRRELASKVRAYDKQQNPKVKAKKSKDRVSPTQPRPAFVDDESSERSPRV